MCGTEHGEGGMQWLNLREREREREREKASWVSGGFIFYILDRRRARSFLFNRVPESV